MLPSVPDQRMENRIKRQTTRTVEVVLSRTLLASDRQMLAPPLNAIVASKGEGLVSKAMNRDRIPSTYAVHTEGW